VKLFELSRVIDVTGSLALGNLLLGILRQKRGERRRNQILAKQQLLRSLILLIQFYTIIYRVDTT
jgi:hypothetical protein